MANIEDIYCELVTALDLPHWKVKWGFFSHDIINVPKVCTTFIIVPRDGGYYYFVNADASKKKNHENKYDVWTNPNWYVTNGDSGKRGRGDSALGSQKQQLARLRAEIKQKQLLASIKQKILDKRRAVA